MGHVLGIGGHSPEVTDVMNSFPRVTAPSARDVQTLRAVWRRAVELLL
jgi:predicted Zn-dependent protease